MEIVPGPDFSDRRPDLAARACAKPIWRGAAASSCARQDPDGSCARPAEAIVLDEIPYQVNKASLRRSPNWPRKSASRASPTFQDRSDRVGIRVVVELWRDATAEVVLNQLFRFTQMQTSFRRQYAGAERQPPEQLTLRDFLVYFIQFREEVVARRTAMTAQGASARMCFAVLPSRSRTSMRWWRRSAHFGRCRRRARTADGAALAP